MIDLSALDAVSYTQLDGRAHHFSAENEGGGEFFALVPKNGTKRQKCKLKDVYKRQSEKGVCCFLLGDV